MYIKRIKGHPYIYNSHRSAGRIVQKCMGRATPEMVDVIEAAHKEREKKAEEVRLLRQQECDDQDRLDVWWKNVKEQVRAAMEVSGYHNPKGRGWRMRRSGGPTK